MEVEVIDHVSFLIVKVIGDITIDDAIVAQNRIEDACISSKKVQEVAIDLSQVGTIDESGMGSVIAAMTSTRAKGIRVLLYRPAEHVQNLMNAMDLSLFFPIIRSEEDLISRLPD